MSLCELTVSIFQSILVLGFGGYFHGNLVNMVAKMKSEVYISALEIQRTLHCVKNWKCLFCIPITPLKTKDI